ncbi:periplasmic nitrate reductase, NapE protein [Roseovarius sp. MBR-154]
MQTCSPQDPKEEAVSERQATEPASPTLGSRRQEIGHFLILAFGIWPVLAVGVVGGYGFLVWMYQLVLGPPGPSGH